MMQEMNTRPPSIFLMRPIQVLTTLALFVALLNSAWELAFLGCTILAMVLGTLAWSRMSLKKVHCQTITGTLRLFPGETLNITVDLENAKVLPVWMQLQAKADHRLLPQGTEQWLSEETWIRPYEKRRFVFHLLVRQRGVYGVGPLGLRGGDLLGFFSKCRKVPAKFQAIVYPRVRPITPIPLPRRDIFGQPGARHPVVDPVYLLGTQDYQHRRPAKFIHWKASARLNRLQEKLCEPSAQAKVLLTIDVAQFQENGASELFEEMLEAAASLAVQRHRQGVGVGLLTNGHTQEKVPRVVSAGYGPKQLTILLETMARLQMRAEEKMTDTLMTGIDQTAGVSFAHFSLTRNARARDIEKIFRFFKLRGVYIFGRPMADTRGNEQPLPPDSFYLKDVFL